MTEKKIIPIVIFKYLSLLKTKKIKKIGSAKKRMNIKVSLYAKTIFSENKLINIRTLK